MNKFIGCIAPFFIILLTSCNRPSLKIEEERVTGRPVCKIVNNYLGSSQAPLAALGFVYYSRKISSKDGKIKGSLHYVNEGKNYTFTNDIDILFDIDSVPHPAEPITTKNNCVTETKQYTVHLPATLAPLSFGIPEDKTYRTHEFMLPLSTLKKLSNAKNAQVHLRGTKQHLSKESMHNDIIYQLTPENIKVIKELYENCINKN